MSVIINFVLLQIIQVLYFDIIFITHFINVIAITIILCKMLVNYDNYYIKHLIIPNKINMHIETTIPLFK